MLFRRSDRAELPVAGVAEARDDVPGIVEPLVDGGGDHPDRQPRRGQRDQALRRGQRADRGDVGRARAR